MRMLRSTSLYHVHCGVQGRLLGWIQMLTVCVFVYSIMPKESISVVSF